jgi:hypothetical protein
MVQLESEHLIFEDSSRPVNFYFTLEWIYRYTRRGGIQLSLVRSWTTMKSCLKLELQKFEKYFSCITEHHVRLLLSAKYQKLFKG